VGTRPVAAKSLWVLRHAKAASQGLDDHSRPLTARGTRQAAEVGSYLARSEVAGVRTPELVLSSSARRAVQTAELVVAALAPEVELVVEPSLYQAGADDIIEMLRLLDGDASSVLVVGHNPTVHDLVLLLLDDEDTEGRARLRQGFPTAALAVAALSTSSWARVAPGTATLLELRTPDR
jgi:phosphohistidine phosphatase